MRALMTIVIGIVFGAGAGVVFAGPDGAASGGHDHSATMQHTHADHAPLVIDAATAPKLEIKGTKNPMAGYNLHVVVEGFAFAPQSASLAHVAGEGHAHVYANGVKLSRLYGEWMHLDALPKGEVVIEVSLNANDHRPLAVEGVPITAKTMIMVD